MIYPLLHGINLKVKQYNQNLSFFLSSKILNVFYKSYFVYKCFPSNYTHRLLFFEQCTTNLIPFGSLYMPCKINVNTDNQSLNARQEISLVLGAVSYGLEMSWAFLLEVTVLRGIPSVEI